MCNKKKDWKYGSVKELAEEFTKDLKDEGKDVKEFKVVVLEPKKKERKKEPECKKRKNKYQKTYL
jgi:hypothetical protein